jgi:hypothetical protein
LFVGGDFQTLGGATRYGVGSVDIASGTVDAWDPSLGSFGASVAALAVSGSTVFVGGDFATMSGASRANLAALDIDSALPLNWDAPITREIATTYIPHVAALAVTPGGLSVGGQFDTVLAAPRGSLARVDFPDQIFHNGYE